MLKSINSIALKLVKFIYFFIAFLIGCMIVFKSIDYLHPDFSGGFLLDKKEIFNVWYKYFLYAHIFSAPVALFTGILQFSLNRKAKLHRLLGYVYVVAVGFAAVGGFFMSFKSVSGMASGISFLILSVLWIYFTWKAFTIIKNGDIEAHKRYMTRSFILTNSAVLLRVFSFISNNYVDVNPVSAYIFNAWISWLPWLLVYEGIRKWRGR